MYTTSNINSESCSDINSQLRENGFSLVPPDFFRIASDDPSWKACTEAFDQLPKDAYLRPEFGCRFRRHAAWRWSRSGDLNRLPAGPYLQSKGYNPLVGNLDRFFSPIEADCLPILEDIINNILGILPGKAENVRIDAHLVRIISTDGLNGVPCPEGVHRDGFQFVSIHAFNIKNVRGAQTTLFDEHGQSVLSFSLLNPLQSVIVNDEKFSHYTSEFCPNMPGPALRDVLLMSYSW